MCEKFPGATRELVEHVVAFWRVLDIAVISGISFKLSKLQLARASVMLLGERVGREGRTVDERKVVQKHQ